MKKWLLFFAPRMLAPYITQDSSIAQPFMLNAIMSLLISKIYTSPGLHKIYITPPTEGLMSGPYEIAADALGPLILAIGYHSLARIILKARGSPGRATRLFYYAAVGYGVCDIWHKHFRCKKR